MKIVLNGQTLSARPGGAEKALPVPAVSPSHGQMQACGQKAVASLARQAAGRRGQVRIPQ